MKITVIGTGNAFSEINYNASFLLEEDGRRMLIDCGQQVLAGLRNQKIDINSIDDIYVSHLHGDHTGSLEAIGFLRYDWMSKPQLAIYNPKSPSLLCHTELKKELWEKTLCGGMESIEGIDATLDTFFRNLRTLRYTHQEVIQNSENTFMWMGWKGTMIQQVHIMTGSKISSTFGLMMEKEGKPTLYFTTDSQYCSPNQIQVFYKKADIIFQDCEVIPFCSGVHANYIQLAGYPEADGPKLSKEIKAKMWLTHYQDVVTKGLKMVHTASPFEFYKQTGSEGLVPFNWLSQAKEDGFKGFMWVGQVLEV